MSLLWRWPFGEDVAVCTLRLVGDGTAAVFRIHVVPWSFRKRVHLAISHARHPLWQDSPSHSAGSEVMARLLVDAMALKRCAVLLGTLDYLHDRVQREYEGLKRRQAGGMGFAHPLAALAHPALAHDPCTLYADMMLSLVPNEFARDALEIIAQKSLPRECACGAADPWRVSSYAVLPRAGGGVRLECRPDPLARCSACHRPAAA